MWAKIIEPFLTLIDSIFTFVETTEKPGIA